MANTLWLLAKDIVADALERPEAERAAVVEERCAGRPDLKEEVESLLDAHLRAGRFIDQAFVPASIDDASADPDLQIFRPGAAVGAYRLLKEIGRGGMGAVYLAERADHAFDKHVAIKIVAGQIAAPDLTQRFLEERRILATLDHPNIAHVLDAGATADGLPFAMRSIMRTSG